MPRPQTPALAADAIIELLDFPGKMANVAGLFVDRSRRVLYAALLLVTVLWLILIVVTWSNLDRWEFLLN